MTLFELLFVLLAAFGVCAGGAMGWQGHGFLGAFVGAPAGLAGGAGVYLALALGLVGFVRVSGWLAERTGTSSPPDDRAA